MKIDQIQTLVAVVDTGSISQAASLLNKTQPAISMTLKRMEQTAGFALFNRNGYRLQLTDKGDIYHQKCKLILEQIQQLNSFSESLNNDEEHQVILSIEDSIEFEPIFDKLIPIQNAFPNTQLKINSESQLKSLSLLNKEKSSLAFTPWLATFSNEGQFESKQVSTIEVGYCVHKLLLERFFNKKSLAKIDSSDITESILSQLPQIVPSEFAINLDKNTLFKSIGRSIIKVNSYNASLAAIKSGMGWGPVIKSPNHSFLDQKFVHFQVEPDSSPINAEIRIVKNKNKNLGVVAKKIWESF